MRLKNFWPSPSNADDIPTQHCVERQWCSIIHPNAIYNSMTVVVVGGGGGVVVVVLVFLLFVCLFDCLIVCLLLS